MRPVLPGDLDLSVRVMLALPAEARRAAMDMLIRQADAADRYRLATGAAHPLFGTGSLMAAAFKWPCAALPGTCDAHYCEGLAVVLEALAAWRGRRPGVTPP